jgi:hypothetical protein
MHSMPYLIKNPAGTWCVQRKVPEKLQAAVARILGGKKPAQVYLKKSLATKDRREATRRAPHALADIDRTLREAAALTTRPEAKAVLRSTLTDTEIKRMAEYVYAKALAWDERTRYGRDEMKRMEAEHIGLEGRPLSGPWAYPYVAQRRRLSQGSATGMIDGECSSTSRSRSIRVLRLPGSSGSSFRNARSLSPIS